MKNIESTLRQLMDFSIFTHNKKIDRLLRDAESRYGEPLTDEQLFTVSAAGDMEIDLQSIPGCPEAERKSNHE